MDGLLFKHFVSTGNNQDKCAACCPGTIMYTSRQSAMIISRKEVFAVNVKIAFNDDTLFKPGMAMQGNPGVGIHLEQIGCCTILRILEDRFNENAFIGL